MDVFSDFLTPICVRCSRCSKAPFLNAKKKKKTKPAKLAKHPLLQEQPVMAAEIPAEHQRRLLPNICFPAMIHHMSVYTPPIPSTSAPLRLWEGIKFSPSLLPSLPLSLSRYSESVWISWKVLRRAKGRICLDDGGGGGRRDQFRSSAKREEGESLREEVKRRRKYFRKLGNLIWFVGKYHYMNIKSAP